MVTSLMSSLYHYPTMSALNEETEPDRVCRLHEAFGVMCSIARMIWREETGYDANSAASGTVRWDGSVIALRDIRGHLEVIWASAPHQQRYGVLAELAWEAMSEPRANVSHHLPS
jgi:hypothetical protein